MAENVDTVYCSHCYRKIRRAARTCWSCGEKRTIQERGNVSP